MIRTVLATLAAGVALVAFAPAAEADSPPVLKVSQNTDLAEGQKITVAGTGFKPGLQQVAVGMCREGYKNGLKDCDLGGGATFVNIDGKGNLPTVTLTTKPKFLKIDCMTQQCVIGVAPLPGTNPAPIIAANTAVMRVGFKGSSFKGGAVAAPPAAAAPAAGTPDATSGPSTLLWALTLGLLVIVAGTAIAGQHRR